MLNDLKKTFKDYNFYINGHTEMFRSSVLVPLVRKDGKIHILYQVRSSTLSVQPNEISFPGGKYERDDKSFKLTAIRETCEELGIREDSIEIISPLDIFVAPFNLIINPFLGVINDFDNLEINKDEVDHVFLVPIDFFLENEPERYETNVDVIPQSDFPYGLIPHGRNYKFKKGKYEIYLYKYKEYVIWGITAKITKNFIDTYKYLKNNGLEI